MQSK